MKRIFIIHGWTGHNNQDWFPWAKKEFTKLGYQVIVPEMPNSDNPQLESWLNKLTEVIGTPLTDDIYIGHSMSVLALLKYIDKFPENTKIDKLISVAGWEKLSEEAVPLPEDKLIFHNWIKQKLDYVKIRKIVKSITAIFSDNDPWVPYIENRKIFKDKLGSKIQLLKNMGHFMKSEGNVTELPILVDLIREN